MIVGNDDSGTGKIMQGRIVSGDRKISRDRLTQRLAGYKKPKTLEFVDALPKNASGKILRRVVRDQLREQR